MEEKKRKGKQFEPGNKAAEKWTEEIALELGEELIAWLKKSDKNIFYQEFLCIENDYYEDLTNYLCTKFTSFSELIKRAKEIQEMKLVKLGIANKLQPALTIFCLKNHHNYKDKKEISGNVNTTDYSKLSTEELVERAKALDKLNDTSTRDTT